MTPPEVEELAAAARLFLVRHEEALAAADPARVAEACEGLLEGLEPLVAQARALAPGAAAEVVGRRAAECEGALLHLRLTARNAARPPPDAALARRLAMESFLAHRMVAGLQATLALWSGAPLPAGPAARLRAARECLLAGAWDAAGASLLPALEEALARCEAANVEPPEGAQASRDALEALRRGLREGVEAWRLLDLVAAVVERAGRTPR